MVDSEAQHKRGQSAVELALMLPLLVLLLVGLVEVVFYARTYLVLLSAIREGARIGARGAANFDNSEILTLIQQNLSREGYEVGLLDVIIVRADIGPGRVVNSYAAASMLGSGQPAFLASPLIQSRLDDDDPQGRLIGVEAYYSHEPLIGFPLLSGLFPDPTIIHTYSIMRMLQ